MTFHVGQKVVCVDDKSPPVCWRGDAEWPRKGEIYTISWAGTCPYWGKPSVQLAEFPTFTGDGRDIRYQAKRFRPIVERKTDISIFQAMLTPSPKQPIREKTAKVTAQTEPANTNLS